MYECLPELGTDIIIPVHNQYHLTRNLLEGIYRYTEEPFHIYLIDNASTDDTVDLHKIYTRNITVVHNRRNRGWCAGINQGICLGRNPNVVFMEATVEVSRGWLSRLSGFLDSHPRIGAVGPLVSNNDGWQNIDRVREKLVPEIPQFLTEDLHERNRILEFHFQGAGILVAEVLSLFCVALKRRAVAAVGPVNAGAPDCSADYCRRLRKAGYVLGLSLDTYVHRHRIEF